MDVGKERLLDFLFPCDQPSPQTDEQATQLHLPDDLFPLVARYSWAGGMSAEEKAAAAADAEATPV